MRKISIGDVVEVRYPQSHIYAEWNGFRLQVTSTDPIKGKVLKTVSAHAGVYPVGGECTWGYISIPTWWRLEGLVVVSSKNEQPSPNQAYIDHIFERLTQNATPEELLILAARLESFATK